MLFRRVLADTPNLMYTIQKLDFMRNSDSKTIRTFFEQEFQANMNLFHYRFCAARSSDFLSLYSDTQTEKAEFQMMKILEFVSSPNGKLGINYSREQYEQYLDDPCL